MILARIANSSLYRFLAFVLLTCGTHTSSASLFEEDAALHVELRGPLDALIDNNDQTQWRFTLHASGIDHPLRVRTRGKSRQELCPFPLLRLNFPKDVAADSEFSGQDKLKLVTHCRDRGSSRVDVLQEYAAYRILNLLSDFSYRVRLLDITYIGVSGEAEETTARNYAFLIESDNDLADRLGAETVSVPAISLASLDKQQAATVFIFQYLIGNTDWSLVAANLDDACCHNADLFDFESRRYYVPHDFDLSGIVNTRYARPAPETRLRRVTQRRYRGFCISPDAVRNALMNIKDQREDILGIIEQLPLLSAKERQATTLFINEFFEEAEDEDKLLRDFEKRCL